MRLHHLDITAFGPFADTTSIDFDALSEAGLFLLSGPTGAGKSSVLDAVCFALYGDVPGDRSVAKRLRSDHAGDDVAPRVVLEATLSGRRFRIDRSPSWVRPKKRGSGFTTEQAHVVISERRADPDGTEAWHPLSTRLDETGHLVTRLVGMTLPQFCQVAMLPQGRFQAFLRARSEERQALLQQVFATSRFDRVERWLRDRRLELHRSSQAHRGALADLVSRVSEVAAATPPDDWAEDPEVLTGWIEDLVGATASAATEQATIVRRAQTLEAEAGAASAGGIELAGRRATHAAAVREAAALDVEHREHADRRSRLDAARRALPVQPLHELALAARATSDALDQRTRSARTALLRLLGADDLDDQQVCEHQRAATRALTDLARVRPLQSEADALSGERAEIARTREETVRRVRAVTDRAAALPDLLDAATLELSEAREAGALVVALQRSVEGLCVRLDAAESVDALTSELAGAEQALAGATQERLLARETLVEIRERRLAGMAAEIAGRLAVGACCPVCGSAEHPSPASASPGAPDDLTERAARKVVDDLEVVVEAHSQQVRGLASRCAGALATADGTSDGLRAELDAVRARLEVARTHSAAEPALASRLHTLTAEQHQLTTERELLGRSLAASDTEVAVLASRIDVLRAQVAAVAPDGSDLDVLAVHQQRVETAAGRLLECSADLSRAHDAADRADVAVASAAVAAGFHSAADAATAWLPDRELAVLEAQIERHEREVARLAECLSAPELAAAAAAEPPDLEALARALHGSREALEAARLAEGGLRDRTERLLRLRVDVDTAVAAWAPVRDEHELVGGLASLVEGKHPDNRLQMRLSAYVLAHRLGQVVDAANLRLATMSDQRYSLIHTGRRGAGEARGGLSLLVRDEWTGDSRDPATLSGGETFVVSLALALGLADVITDEVGGADLDTLFVDEGFGSLDADTLEDVMDTLDTLRDGGRVVGVVSHVPELQTRIPTQLRVHRARHGSRTALSLG